MSAFRFSLQQVLTYRGQLKEQALVQLGRAQAELNREQARAAELDVMIVETEDKLFGPKLMDTSERWLLEHFVRGLRTDAATTRLRIQSLAEQRDAVQAEVVTRAREEKILEKLKEKQAARHAADERMKELRSYDETAAIRYKAPAF